MIVDRTMVINEFAHRLAFVFSGSHEAAGRQIAQLRAEASARGAYGSSYLILAPFEVAREHLDLGIKTAVSDYEVALTQLPNGADELNEALSRQVRVFVDGLLELTRPKGSSTPTAMSSKVEEFQVSLRTRANSLLRQHQAGYLSNGRANGPSFHMTVNNPVASAVQQGGQGNSQNLTFGDIDFAVVREAMDGIVTADGQPLPRELAADLESLRVQLSKAAPSPGVLKEAGKSARNVVEGLAAGVLTPHAITAAAVLWRALGL